MRVFWRYVAVVVAGVCVAVVGASAGVAAGRKGHVFVTRGARPLRTALFDPWAFTGAQQVTAFSMARSAGASYVRLVVSWSQIAPITPSPGFVAADPASVGYSWAWLDQTVTEMEADGLVPILDVVGPPSWALAKKGKPPKAGAPSVPALRAFETALALRYDGSNGLPRVRVFEVWNEPNLSLDLYPVRAASRYRAMVNAVAGAVHGVSRSNIVVAGGLDPFENLTKRFVSQAPLAFMRAFLCLSKGKHPHRTCRAKVHFDVWSHHPYTFGGPFGHARFPDDVSLGDLPRMRALLREGVKLHRVVSSRKVQFWVTEFSWDTNPPRRHAAPLNLQARWTAESLYQMWRSGVSLVTWYMLQDQPSPSPNQSGLYFHSKSLQRARAKPTRTAFRFPFVAYLGQGKVSVWGRDATSDKRLVTIQLRHGRRGRWRTVARVRSNRSGIFLATLRLNASSRDWVRARAAGSGNSLAFSLTVPKKQRYGPWGN